MANYGDITLAVDITITDALRLECIAHELVNRIQNIRKDSGYEVTDRMNIRLEEHPMILLYLADHRMFIAAEVLANNITSDSDMAGEATELVHNV